MLFRSLERIDELDSRYESMLGEAKIRQDAEKKRNEQEANRIRDEKTRESNETIRKSQELSRKSAEDKRVTAEEQRKSKFDGWDKTMEGVIPNATDISTGVVKVDKAEDEEAPYTVPTIGRLDSAIAVLKGDVAKKQDKLTAGDNIDIIGDTISAVDTVYKKPLSEPISYIQGLQAELDSKVESYGTNPVLNIAVISAGGSTTGIPNNTLILELE